MISAGLRRNSSGSGARAWSAWADPGAGGQGGSGLHFTGRNPAGWDGRDHDAYPVFAEAWTQSRDELNTLERLRLVVLFGEGHGALRIGRVPLIPRVFALRAALFRLVSGGGLRLLSNV